MASDWLLEEINSGGQTGADQGGLRAAAVLGYRTGGMMPLGWKTEAGPRPEFRELYSMIESRFAGYEHRTRWNVRMTEGTVIFAAAGKSDGGSAITASMAAAFDRPVLRLDPSVAVAAQTLRAWVLDHQIRVLNVAGNRESKSPGIGMAVELLLLEALAR